MMGVVAESEVSSGIIPVHLKFPTFGTSGVWSRGDRFLMCAVCIFLNTVKSVPDKQKLGKVRRVNG